MKYYIINSSGMRVGESGESIGSGYDLNNACFFCGTGAKYVGKFIIKPPRNKAVNVFQTLDSDFIVSDIVYKHLLDNKCKVDFPITVNTKGKDLQYRHLTSKIELPKVHYSPYLRVDPLSQCIYCKRNGWLGTAFMKDGAFLLTYFNIPEAIFDSSDVFITWERNGVSKNIEEGEYGIRFARPFIIVSQKVKNVLMKYSKHLIFEEVSFTKSPV